MLRAALAVGSLCIAMAMQSPARGVVVDPAGRPVQFATVFSWWQAHPVETDAAGAFVTEIGQYRILADGYAPRIVSSEAFAKPIVLREATTPRRNLPRCVAGVRGIGSLHVPTPSGVDLAGAGHDDYVSETWSRRGAELDHAHGPTLTDGLPLESVLAELVEVDDRDVRVVLDDGDPDTFPITDVRGRFANGRRYRYVGYVGERFTYSGLTAADAAFFDRMLDAMCYVDREPATVAVRR